MNQSTRQVVVDYYGGTGGATLIGWNWLNQAGGTVGWTVLAAADFDGNGTPYDFILPKRQAGAPEDGIGLARRLFLMALVILDRLTSG